VTTTVELTTTDGPMGLHVARPVDPPRGGIVVVQEAFGLTPHIASIADRLAAAGYLAAAPHLFHRTGDPVIAYGDFDQVKPHMQALRAETLDGDVDAALDFLRGERIADADIAVVGFCMGGTVALATAARTPLGAAATFYGGGIRDGRFGYPPLRELAPQLATPWVGFYGDADQGIPIDQVDELRAAAAHAPVDTAVHRYPGAGHGFNCDDRDAYHPDAAADAWSRMLDWFAKHLPAGQSAGAGPHASARTT
jgi:carboxymethylenebutenolidase